MASKLRKCLYRITARLFHSMTSFSIRKKITFIKGEYFYRVHGIGGIADLIARSPSDMIEPLLVRYGASVGKRFTCKSGLQIEATVFGLHKDLSNLHIGFSCTIARNVYLDLSDIIIMEDYAVLGPQVCILTHSSLADKPLKLFYPSMYKQVVIEKGSWIGAGATILAGVNIGSYAVVGAGSVVTRDVPPLSIVKGIPAKVVGRLPHEPQ